MLSIYNYFIIIIHVKAIYCDDTQLRHIYLLHKAHIA